MATGSRAVGAPHAALTAFAPTVAIDWLADEPDTRHKRVDASMVFVDISGFTALSERLAGFGREGAEEITEILGSVFERLLAVAYANRGSLVKFGGDALFLLFTGDDHPTRAACSADGMRRELLALGALGSLAGKVRLGMTVGAHSGDVDLFLVGDSHREFIVAGPGASTVVRAEESAETGQVIVSPEMAARIDQRWLRGPQGLGVELGRTPGADLGGEVEIVPKVHDATQLIPTAIRRFLTAGGSGAEHRQAVVAFVAYHGTDDLLAGDGPEACADALHDLVSRTAAACDQHDITLLGTDVAPGGGKLILVGGAPVGHDDDIERVLRASREIVAEPSPFEVHIGVNPGPLFSGVIGPFYRLTYTVMGDTVNLAARLAYKVGDRQVLTTAQTLTRTRSQFASAPVEPFLVKGKTEPIEAAIVGESRETRLDIRDPLPLLGRDEELATLRAVMATTRTDGGQVVELVGPAGIGKSRLLREFRDEYPERHMYYGGCTSYEQATPYFAFRGLMRFLLGLADEPTAPRLIGRLERLDADLVPWASLVGNVIDIDVPPSPEVEALDPKFLAAKLRSVVADTLLAVLDDDAILRIEDVHWIDEASRALLDHLIAEVLPGTSWLLLLTSREGAFGGRATTIALGPLGPQAVERLAHAGAERGLVTLDVAVQLAQRAEGNPLFLQELLAFASRGDEEVPDSVERLIGARLDQLEPLHRDLLRHAALLGSQFDIGLLRSITGREINAEDLRVLDAFLDRDEKSGQYTFEHDLYREVAYQALPYRRRRELHDRAGRVIETRFMGRTEEAAEILALHYYRAGQHERAWKHNRIAAQRAKERYANADAVRFYRWALESGSRSRRATAADRVAMWTDMADLLELMGSYDQAEAVLAKARKAAADDQRPGLWYRSGVIRERQGRYSQALRWYGRARRSAPEGAPPEARLIAARARLRTVEAHIRQGRTDAAREAAAVLPELEAVGDLQLLARGHFVCGWALRTGPIADQHRLRSLVLYREAADLAGQSLVENELGISAYYRGDWDEALLRYEAGRDLNERLGDRVSAAVASNNIGEILSDQGRYDEASHAFETCLEVASAARYAIAVGVATSNLGRCAARRGDHDRAAALLDRAGTTFAAIGATDFLDDVAARTAELALFAGDHERARELASTLTHGYRGGAAVAPALAFARRIEGCAAAILGQTDDARRMLQQAAAWSASAGASFDEALCTLALATLVDDGDADGAQATLQRFGLVGDGRDLLLGPDRPPTTSSASRRPPAATPSAPRHRPA